MIIVGFKYIINPFLKKIEFNLAEIQINRTI